MIKFKSNHQSNYFITCYYRLYIQFIKIIITYIWVQYVSEDFNIFRDQGFDVDADNNEIADTLNSPLVGSSEFQERNDNDHLDMEQEIDRELDYNQRNKRIRFVLDKKNYFLFF